MKTDPRIILQEAPMSGLQVLVIAITVLLNALDGFDILSISFASPGIAAEWGLGQSGLGFVLSMELIGMGIGSFALGSVADKYGRRPTILGCLLVMTLGMLMATTTSSIVELSIWRVVTGVGIGGMLAAINAVAAEFSNARRKHLAVSIMAIGYPLGGVVGGFVAARLLETYSWRSVFYLGGGLTAAMIPLVWFFVPESVHWLARKQPAGALEKINSTFRRFKLAAVSALPVITDEARRKSSMDIFSPALIKLTSLVACAYFLHITTFYFILKWTPKLVSDMGFAASSAGDVLVWANVGGALGGATFGFLTMRFGLKQLTVAVVLLSGIFVAIFGRTPADLSSMAFLAAVAGFFGNAGIVGLYAIVAHAFPTHTRAFATGFVIGFGRGGSVLSPILAGFLLESGLGLPGVGMAMGVGSLIAAGVLFFLKLDHDNPSKGAHVEDDSSREGAQESAQEGAKPSLA